MGKLDMSVQVDLSEVDRIAIGVRLYDAFSWDLANVNLHKMLHLDTETQCIEIKESDLLRLIQLVNSGQPDRHIELIKDIV